MPVENGNPIVDIYTSYQGREKRCAYLDLGSINYGEGNQVIFTLQSVGSMQEETRTLTGHIVVVSREAQNFQSVDWDIILYPLEDKYSTTNPTSGLPFPERQLPVDVTIDETDTEGRPIVEIYGYTLRIPEAEVGDEITLTGVSKDQYLGKQIYKAEYESYNSTTSETFDDEDENLQNSPTTDPEDLATDMFSSEKASESESKDATESVPEKEHPQTQISETELEELRAKAVNEGEENLEPIKNPQPQSKEYTRSQAVKIYVKKRAGNDCEGCKEPAPFINSSGEPYLHAHHVHELSEGGSDTYETVIAICPNCHYRVHHGRDGGEYNDYLIERLAEIEDTPVERIENI